MAAGLCKAIKTRRLSIRATSRQQKLIRAGARCKGQSISDFILESACLRAEQALAGQGEFVVSSRQWKTFVKALDRPARAIPELVRLFSETESDDERGAKRSV